MRAEFYDNNIEVRIQSKQATRKFQRLLVEAGHLSQEPEPEAVDELPPEPPVPMPRYIDWQPSLMDLLLATSIKHGVTIDDMRGPCRARPYARARHEYCWLAKSRTTKSLNQIGMLIGGRDHTTVLNGIRRHQAWLEGRA